MASRDGGAANRRGVRLRRGRVEEGGEDEAFAVSVGLGAELVVGASFGWTPRGHAAAETSNGPASHALHAHFKPATFASRGTSPPPRLANAASIASLASVAMSLSAASAAAAAARRAAASAAERGASSPPPPDARPLLPRVAAMVSSSLHVSSSLDAMAPSLASLLAPFPLAFQSNSAHSALSREHSP